VHPLRWCSKIVTVSINASYIVATSGKILSQIIDPAVPNTSMRIAVDLVKDALFMLSYHIRSCVDFAVFALEGVPDRQSIRSHFVGLLLREKW